MRLHTGLRHESYPQKRNVSETSNPYRPDMAELTPQGLMDMLGPEFEHVTATILESATRVRSELITKISNSENGLRAEMNRRFDRVDIRFDEFRDEVKGEFVVVRGEISELRAELKGEIGELKGEIGELKGEIGEIKSLIRSNAKRRKR
jgi:hypothetical protein